MTADLVRVRLQQKKHVYIHNDLSNSSRFLVKRVRKRLDNGDREGIAFDIMSALTMLAFKNEAHLNFIGDALIKSWNERANFHVKIKAIVKHLEIELNENEQPLKDIKQNHDFRNLIAHRKPSVEENDEEIVLSKSELDQQGYLTAEWEKFVTEEFLFHAEESSNIFWKLLLEKSGLNLFDTMTRGNHSISFIEHVD